MSKCSFMRLLLFFDLPVETAMQRGEYRRFVKYLSEEGFIMVQYSVYAKLCINNDSVTTASRKVDLNTPTQGNVRYIAITEKQYQRICNVNNTYSIQEEITTTDRTIMIGEMNNED